MTTTHHLDDATLMSFAAGSLPGALSAVAATHIAVCPRCRKELAHFERVGGALVASLAPVSMLCRDLDAPAALNRSPPTGATVAGEVPAPLAHSMSGGLDGIRWRWLGPGIWLHRLTVPGSGTLQLVKAGSGRSLPGHGHNGAELTLVLRGSYHDGVGRFATGDVADLDEEVEHRPVAGEAGCICVVASERPARFHGVIARLMQPWHGL